MACKLRKFEIKGVAGACARSDCALSRSCMAACEDVLTPGILYVQCHDIRIERVGSFKSFKILGVKGGKVNRCSGPSNAMH